MVPPKEQVALVALVFLLILWLKKALVLAFPDERGPFRESRAAEGPPVRTLPRALLQAWEQAMGIHQEPGGKTAGHQAAHLSARTPSCVKTTYGRISQGIAFFQTPNHTTKRSRGRLILSQKGIFKSSFSHIYSHSRCLVTLWSP